MEEFLAGRRGSVGPDPSPVLSIIPLTGTAATDRYGFRGTISSAVLVQGNWL